MTPGTRAPSFLLLLLLVLTVRAENQKLPKAAQCPAPQSSTVSMTSSLLPTLSPGSGSAALPGQKNAVTLSQSSSTTKSSADTSTTATGIATSGLATFTLHTGSLAPATSSTSASGIPAAHDGTSAPATSSASGPATPAAHDGTSAAATSSASGPATPAAHDGSSAPATSSASGSATPTAHDGTSAPATSSASATPAAHDGTSAAATSSASGSATPAVHDGTSAPATSSMSVSATPTGHEGTSAPATTSSVSVSPTPTAHEGTSAPATSSVSVLATTLAHSGSSAVASTTPVSKESQSSFPSYQSPTSTPFGTPGSGMTTGSTEHSTAPPSPPSSHSPQPSGMVSLFFLFFEILNLQFNSSLEDPSTRYYQELEKNISGLFFQTYQQDFLGLLSIKFRPGSVAVESMLIFRKGTASDYSVWSRLTENKAEAERYNLVISQVKASEVQAPSPTAQARVPGWGIALLVLVCVLVLLALVYYITLAVFQCRRKSYGHLDIFPTRDTYHPMSEYPTYHTHGRYVPPGSTRRSPYEEVSAGNGGGSLSYTNPAVAATSANL